MSMPGGFVDGESYLESLIESLSTLPAELRRNLELMKDMDGSCSSLLEETMRMQQEYLWRVEDKMGKLEIVDGIGVRVLTSGRERVGGGVGDGNDEAAAAAAAAAEETATATRDDDDEAAEPEHPLPVVIPTTEELLAYVHEPATRSSIESLRTDALQHAEEKVAIAHQTYELVDNLCRKLDTDLAEMERCLLARNGPGFHSGAAGGIGGIGSAAADALPTTGAGAGHGHNRRAPKKDDLAAVQEVHGSPDWILAKVIAHDPQTGMFRLSDEDSESNKIFNLPESQVVILERMKNLRIGDVVFAVYPDTTSFYQGTIAQPPRKAAGGGGMFVMVTFVDDEDVTTGKTLDKAVLLKHVMPPPF